AIEAAIAEGININITLMFSVEVYRRVAQAYLNGLRTRLANGQEIHRVASVASFFVSRVDTKVDKLLEQVGTDTARNCRGTEGISMEQVTAELLAEGIVSFAKSFDELIGTIGSKRQALAPA